MCVKPDRIVKFYGMAVKIRRHEAYGTGCWRTDAWGIVRYCKGPRYLHYSLSFEDRCFDHCLTVRRARQVARDFCRRQAWKRNWKRKSA